MMATRAASLLIGAMVLMLENGALRGWGETRRHAVAMWLTEAARERKHMSTPTTESPQLSPRAAKVAIVVRTKDRELLLKRALKGIAAQTFSDYVVAVVNDGGAPLDRDALVAESGLDDAKLVLLDGAGGRWAAANTGVRAVSSEYVVIHDDDDSWAPGYLAATTAFLDDPDHARYGGVVAFTDLVRESIADDGTVETIETVPFSHGVEHISIYDLARRNLFPPIAFLHRRAVYEKVGYYDDARRALADWEFNLRVIRHFDIGVVREPLAFWHWRVDQSSQGTLGNVTTNAPFDYEEEQISMLNGLLRADLDSPSPNPGLGVLANLLYFGRLDSDQRAQLVQDQFAALTAAGAEQADSTRRHVSENAHLTNEHVSRTSELTQAAVAATDKSVHELAVELRNTITRKLATRVGSVVRRRG